MQSTEKFFEAFGRAGMLKGVSWKPSSGAPEVTGQAVFRAPTQDVLAGDALAVDFTIQYPATQFVGLKRGERVVIDGATYRLREDPRSELDGSRLRAPLEKQAGSC